MDAVTLVAVVDEDRRLSIEVPDGVPAGPVQLTIRPLPAPAQNEREAIRAKLLAAGSLSTTRYAPPDATPLTSEEREAIGRLFVGPRPMADLIDEDRGPR